MCGKPRRVDDGTGGGVLGKQFPYRILFPVILITMKFFFHNFWHFNTGTFQ
jgi:hypothetical protein